LIIIIIYFRYGRKVCWDREEKEIYHDILFRIRNSSYRLSRPPNHIGRYKMIRHEKRERAVNR
jgi:hypothetical protein